MDWRCLLGMSTFVSSVVISLVLWARDRSAHPNRVFSLSRLHEPPLSRAPHSPWWAPRTGIGYLMNFVFFLELIVICVFLTLSLPLLAVLELRALLSSFPDNTCRPTLYKWSIWKNQWMWVVIICICLSHSPRPYPPVTWPKRSRLLSACAIVHVIHVVALQSFNYFFIVRRSITSFHNS